MTSRRATLPSEAEVTEAVANGVPELANFTGALIAFDAKGADGYHWYILPGQLDLGDEDDPVHVLLDENNVAMLLFKDEKDVVIGAPAVASALATKKSRGAKVLERSALLGAIYDTAPDDAGEKGDELGDTHGGTPSANARAAAARGVAGGVKAPLRLPSPAAPGKTGLGLVAATAELRPPMSTSSPGGRVGDATFASVVRPSSTPASAAPTSTSRQLRPAAPSASSSPFSAVQLFDEPGQGALPGLLPPTSSLRMMAPRASAQAVDATFEELDFRSVEVTAAEIQAMATAAGAGVGAGKKAIFEKSAFGAESRQPRECILFGLSGQEIAMAVPSVVSLLLEHMDLQAPVIDERSLGTSAFVRKYCELLDEILERCAQLLGCNPEVLMGRIYKADTTDTVQSAFSRTRAVMKELTLAYARSAGSNRTAGNVRGNLQFAGPGLNSICCGGPGLGSCLHRGGSLETQVSEGYDGRSPRGSGFQQPQLRLRSSGDGLGGRISFGKEASRCYVDAGGDDDEVGKKSSTSTIQADAFLQSAMNVAEDQQLRFELQELKHAVEADPLTHHAAKVKAFGICATSAPDLMNLLTSANVVMPKGKTDLMPEFLVPVVRAVMRIQAKVLAAMEALLRDLLYYDAIVKPMAKCVVTMDLASLDLKAVMGREGISKLGLDKSKSEAKAAPSTAAFHAVWPVLTFVLSLAYQWDEDINMTMVMLGTRVAEAMMAGHSFADALAPIGFHFQLFGLMAEDLHKGGDSFPSLTDVFEKESKGEFMTAHRSRSIPGVGGVDLASKAFKDAVKAAVKEVAPRVNLPKAKAGSEESGAGTASAKEKGKKQKEWATEVLEEYTFPIPETVNITNKMLAAFRTLNPGVCWKLVMRGVCEADHCPVCSK